MRGHSGAGGEGRLNWGSAAGWAEGRSKQELAVEAIRDAQDRAELKVDDVLAELMDSDAEIPDYLK
ncbi:hypothetical protein [Streptomyces sp. NPDC007083]|uniref:hypothetical protein n=1 Tax=unclassified Streptomyces TaxID=2593676 RepID=UPI0033E1364B